jgi:antitoxin HigA-1
VKAIPLSVTDAAKTMGLTRPALSALLNEHVDLSPEMALRIEKAFSVSMDTLMRMQNN